MENLEVEQKKSKADQKEPTMPDTEISNNNGISNIRNDHRRKKEEEEEDEEENLESINCLSVIWYYLTCGPLFKLFCKRPGIPYADRDFLRKPTRPVVKETLKKNK